MTAPRKPRAAAALLPLFQEPVSRRDAAGLLMIRPDGRVLLTLRQGVAHSGTWSVPGGLLERREDPLKGAVRETSEELGISVRTILHAADVSQPVEHHQYLKSTSHGHAGIFHLYIVYVTDKALPVGKLTPCHETAAIRWVTPENLANLDLHPALTRQLHGLGILR